MDPVFVHDSQSSFWLLTTREHVSFFVSLHFLYHFDCLSRLVLRVLYDGFQAIDHREHVVWAAVWDVFLILGSKKAPGLSVL